MRKIYLDHNATTPLAPEVFKAMEPYFIDKFGNASSIHFFGREARVPIDESREIVAKFLGAHPSEIFFVSSGTEANNFALKGIAWKMREKGRRHIITSKTEHHSVLETCAYLEESGFKITYLGVDDFGMVHPQDVQKAIVPETCIVSIMHGNNEVGTINPVEEISHITKEHNIVFHTDAVQTFGKLPVMVDVLGVDLLSLSAHKFYGPKGIGILYIRRGKEIERLLHGGGQERGKRAGTESVPLVVGFAKATELMIRSRDSETQRLEGLKNKFRTMLSDCFPFIIFNGHPTLSLPNVVNISFDSKKIDIDGEALLFNLDLAGIAVASGSACTSGSIKPSHVLLAMGRDEKTASVSIRFSMGRSTVIEDIEYSVGVLNDVVKRIGKIRN